MMGKVRRFFMLTCEDVNEFLVAYLEDSLKERTKQRFQRHVARCPKCSAYLDQYRQTVELVRTDGALELEDPPDELVELTLAFLRKHYDDES